MATTVGTKGQVVIEKEIRDALGVVPGSVAVQRRVGDVVELRFMPAEHGRSLLGVLASYVTTPLSDGALREAEESAWSGQAVRSDVEATRAER